MTTGVVSDKLFDKLDKGKLAYEVDKENENGFWQQVFVSWLPMLVLVVIFFLFMRQLQVGRRQGDELRQVEGEAARPRTSASDVRGRRRRRGGQGRGRGDHRLPQGPEEVHPARRPHPQGRPDDGPAGHRQDAARPRHRRRGGRAVLLDLAARTSSRCSSASAPAASATCSSRARRTPRASSSSTRSTPSAATAAPASAAVTTSASRRSTSCSSRWTASSPTTASSSSPRPTAPTSSTRRCCGPGRFDRRIVVPRPDVRGRIGHPQGPHPQGAARAGVDLEVIARGTPGFSGADLENLVNEAALIAARRDKDKVEMARLRGGQGQGPDGRRAPVDDHLRQGEARRPPSTRPATRWSASCDGADPVHKVTIIPRGRALGVTQQLPARGSPEPDARVRPTTRSRS